MGKEKSSSRGSVTIEFQEERTGGKPLGQKVGSGIHWY